MTTDPPALLTVVQVAGHLNVSRMTIYREIKRGRLKAVKVGKNYRIQPADLDTYLHRNPQGPPPDG